MSCWAASYSMLLCWRRQQSLSVTRAVANLGPEWVTTYQNDTGLPPGRHEAFAQAAGMRAEPLYNPTIHGWVRLYFIQAGKPIQNCFVESFNGKFRDECLSEHWFGDILHARRIIETWRRDYNEVRPHSALGNLPPREFAERAA